MDERQDPGRRNGDAGGAMAPPRTTARRRALLPPPLPRPLWAPPGTEPVAEAVDLVSSRTYRVWAGPDPGSAKRAPPRYTIEHVGSAAPLAAFASWAEVQAWCDRTLITLGWTPLEPFERLVT
jgi:hypothetical protein